MFKYKNDVELTKISLELPKELIPLIEFMRSDTTLDHNSFFLYIIFNGLDWYLKDHPWHDEMYRFIEKKPD